MMSELMWVLSWSLVAIGWFAWLYPFLFRAPHRQNRDSITVPGPTRLGLLLEGLAIFLAFAFRQDGPVEAAGLAMAVALIVACSAMAWTAVQHLGRQFRVHAGLYHDHQLVRTGPYRIVRHPIYTSLMGMLIATMVLLRTDGTWVVVCLGLFVAGTEIRVRSEEGLLAGRFRDGFDAYRKSVKAYIPFVR
jgi:protein-S-isoprenylcysteine O-methyltransferase Ste14